MDHDIEKMVERLERERQRSSYRKEYPLGSVCVVNEEPIPVCMEAAALLRRLGEREARMRIALEAADFDDRHVRPLSEYARRMVRIALVEVGKETI